MKIIVFGGTGWLGHSIVLDLIRGGYDVTICSRGRKSTFLEKVSSVKTVSADKSDEAAMKEILACRSCPTAIIVQNDVTAMAAMAIAVNAGVKVPEQISFVGFDNILESRYAVPALTTLDIRIEETAAHLADLLMKRIKNPKTPVMSCRIEPELVLRKSCISLKMPDAASNQ